MRITAKQRTVLKRAGVPLSAVFDASGMKPAGYRSAMKPLRKLVAIGVTPCKKERHTMRTRSGNCIECNKPSLEFLKRHQQCAYLYIATSAKRKLLKIGISRNPDARIRIINRLNYGSVADWTVRHQVRLRDAGAIENRLHRVLSAYSKPMEWMRDGFTVWSYETFKCNYRTAKRALHIITSP